MILNSWYLVSIILKLLSYSTEVTYGTSEKVAKMKFRIINNYRLGLLRVGLPTDVTVLQ